MQEDAVSQDGPSDHPDPSGHGQKAKPRSYVLTCDLGQKIKQWHHFKIKTPPENDPFFSDLKKGMKLRLESIFPGVEIKTIDMADLVDEIVGEAMSKKSLLKNVAIVSTCPEIAKEVQSHTHTLEINRIVDLQGNIIGLGPRPGHPGIDYQINQIARSLNGEPVVLIEDGSFTGNTLLFILEKFRRYHVPVAAIVVGFIFPTAMERLKQCPHFKGEIVVIEEIANCIDWVPDHDFFPFVANCGRVLGLSFNGNILPFYTYEGASYSIPYLTTFAPMSEWTSIPPDKVNDFSIFCADQATRLFSMIDSMNDDPVKIGQLLDGRPRISVPLSVGNWNFPSLETSIREYMSETRQMMS